MTLSLTQPMDSDWTKIYLYIAGQSYKRWGKGEIPADITVDSISDYGHELSLIELKVRL